MAAIVVDRGLQRIAVNASQAVGFGASRFIQTGAVDDATGAFLAAHTKLNDAAGFTSEFDVVFDIVPPVLTGNSVKHVLTVPAGSFNAVPMRRVSLHDDTAANVSGSSNTLCAGVDGQSLQKTADFGATFNLILLYSSV